MGTAPNQTINGAPLAATEGGAGPGGALSFLPGQKLSRCTCAGEDHPGPRHPDGTFVGRAAPEIDIFEGQIRASDLTGQVSQSAQWAVSRVVFILEHFTDEAIALQRSVPLERHPR